VAVVFSLRRKQGR